MGIPRCFIVGEQQLVHICWRCHNKSNLLESSQVKDKMMNLYFKHKDEYKIKIFALTALDNHIHMLAKVPNAEALGNYMRRVNSQLARFINKLYKRDSQVIKDRFKSPVIEDNKYLTKVLAYILLNRFKINRKLTPDKDKYNSYYHLLNNTTYGKKLDSISELGLCKPGEELSFLLQLLTEYMNKLVQDIHFFVQYCFQHPFAIGSSKFVETISQNIRAAIKGICLNSS